MIDNYDDTVDAGIAKVKEYISSLARDEQSKILVETVLKLLSKDSKGTLKASRVLQLQQMAEKSGNADFIEGVRIIRDAYRPIESKSYVRAEYKSDSGAWVSVPLGMTEARLTISRPGGHARRFDSASGSKSKESNFMKHLVTGSRFRVHWKGHEACYEGRIYKVKSVLRDCTCPRYLDSIEGREDRQRPPHLISLQRS